MENELCDAAKRISHNAYAPYSNFKVGAAVLGSNGKIYSACNVENASYGLTCCAERNAIFSMVADGEISLQKVAIFTATDLPTAPCGACRQVIREFSREAVIISCCLRGTQKCWLASDLLPDSFGPESLA